jgi:hypothetical protein
MLNSEIIHYMDIYPSVEVYVEKMPDVPLSKQVKMSGIDELFAFISEKKSGSALGIKLF